MQSEDDDEEEEGTPQPASVPSPIPAAVTPLPMPISLPGGDPSAFFQALFAMQSFHAHQAQAAAASKTTPTTVPAPDEKKRSKNSFDPKVETLFVKLRMDRDAFFKVAGQGNSVKQDQLWQEIVTQTIAELTTQGLAHLTVGVTLAKIRQRWETLRKNARTYFEKVKKSGEGKAKTTKAAKQLLSAHSSLLEFFSKQPDIAAGAMGITLSSDDIGEHKKLTNATSAASSSSDAPRMRSERARAEQLQEEAHPRPRRSTQSRAMSALENIANNIAGPQKQPGANNFHEAIDRVFALLKAFKNNITDENRAVMSSAGKILSSGSNMHQADMIAHTVMQTGIDATVEAFEELCDNLRIMIG
jgi:hypothetical protein